MKNKIILIAIGLVTLGINTSVHAAPGNVRFTVHNMSNNNIQSQGLDTATERRVYATGESQVCIFCHTPHNAQPASPLWNKASLTGPITSFRMYTSSSSLSAATRGSSMQPGASSLLCLSCHDGKTAINVLHNASSGIAAAAPYNTNDKVVDFGGSVPVALQDFAFGYLAATNLGGTDANYYAGDDLTNDHPIGFSYTAAQSAPTHTGKLHDIPTVNTKSVGAVRFFGVGSKMECSTCHDPHVNYSTRGTGSNPALKPFLVMDNTGSKLCLSCHNK